MSNHKGQLYNLLAELVASGDLQTDQNGRLQFAGKYLEPEGDDSVDNAVAASEEERFDDQGVSNSVFPTGARTIQSVERIRQKLRNAGRQDLAQKLPQFFFVPPYDMYNLSQSDKYRDFYPDVEWDNLRNMQHSVSKATFLGMGGKQIGYALDVTKDGNPHIPNHRALNLYFNIDARDSGRTISDLVGEYYEGVVEGWKNPSDWR